MKKKFIILLLMLFSIFSLTGCNANILDGLSGLGSNQQQNEVPRITIGENGNWYVDGVDTGASSSGEKGEKGDKGEDGKSAYELYCEAFPAYKGTLEEWLADLVNGDLYQDVIYKVEFKNCDNTVETQYVYKGEKITKPDIELLPGKILSHWEYLGQPWVFHGYVCTEDMELTAVWYDSCAVLYYVDGELYNTSTVGVGGHASKIDAPFKEGKKFAGWYCNGEAFNFYGEVTDHIVLEARYVDYDGAYKLGMGASLSLSINGYGQDLEATATFASVILDGSGEIVDCKVDRIATKIRMTNGGTFYISSTGKTNKELMEEYGLGQAINYGDSYDVNYDGRILEWYEQAEAFEKYVIGMNAEDVLNMPTMINSLGYIMSADDELLAAGCTIQIEEFKEALYKACTDDQGFEFINFGKIKLGMDADSYIEATIDATPNASGRLYLVNTYAAVAMVDDIIVATVNDSHRPCIDVSYDNELISYNTLLTKRELMYDYAMSTSPYSPDNNGDGVILEWFEQSAAFSRYVVGMTADEVQMLPTEENDLGYQISADYELLAAGCTIDIMDMKTLVAEIARNLYYY